MNPDTPSSTALQRALEIQMELTAIVTRGGGADRLLAGWQQRTGEAVAVFNRLGRPLGRSASFSPEALAEVGEALATQPPRLGEVRRLQSGRHGAGEREETTGILELTAFAGNSTVRGYLARVPAEDESAELASPALRSLLALEYERHWLLDEPARRRRAAQLKRVLELGDAGGVRAYLRGIGSGTDELRGLVIEARDETHAEVLVDDLAVILATALIRHRGRIVECLVPIDPRQPLVDYGLEVPIGIGTPVPPEHVSRSMRQAVSALETSRRLGTPIEYLDGAAHEFLIRVASPSYLEAFASAALDPITRSRGGEDLLRTLHLWFVERRSIEATAERMGIHRHTVRNRIQRIAQLIGHDLDSIDTQTELWLALKASGHGDHSSGLA